MYTLVAITVLFLIDWVAQICDLPSPIDSIRDKTDVIFDKLFFMFVPDDDEDVNEMDNKK